VETAVVEASEERRVKLMSESLHPAPAGDEQEVVEEDSLVPRSGYDPGLNG